MLYKTRNILETEQSEAKLHKSIVMLYVHKCEKAALILSAFLKKLVNLICVIKDEITNFSREQDEILGN